jgi:uncharacterized membrane protein
MALHLNRIHPLVEMDYQTSARWAAFAAAGLCVAAGARAPRARWFLTLTAAALVSRGMIGHWPSFERRGLGRDDTRTTLGGGRGIHVRESVRLEKPIEEVYRFWRQLENLPSFMTYLQSVTPLGDGRSRWVARGPAGVRVIWDAEIVNEIENTVIGWRSLPGSDVAVAGSVNFDRVRDGGSTQVTVHLQYAPPAGRVGASVATLFGREPSQTIREDLRRLKQVLEAGEIARAVPDVTTGVDR